MNDELEIPTPSLETLVAVATTQPMRPMTGADLEALAPLVKYFRGQLEPPDPEALLGLLPDLLTALAQLLSVDRAALANIPIHGVLEIVVIAAPRWLDVNARYLSEEVTPRIAEIQKAVNAQATG